MKKKDRCHFIMPWNDWMQKKKFFYMTEKNIMTLNMSMTNNIKAH